MLMKLFILFWVVCLYRSYLAYNFYKPTVVLKKNRVIKALTFGFTSFETFKPV